MLCYHAFDTPSILVLNKLDLDKKDRDIYGLIKKLTCGYLGGVKQVTSSKVRKSDSNSKSLDSYLIRKRKEFEKISQKVLTEQPNSNSEEEHLKITNYKDFFHILKNRRTDDRLISQITNGLVGWPGFNEVFAVSALENKGTVSNLKKLISTKYPKNSVQ